MDKIAQVTGVLHYNDATREEMLKRVYWKDKQYTDFGGNFVKYAEIRDRGAEPPTGGKGILNYTHDGTSEYSSKLRREYIDHGIDADVFNVEDVPVGERWKWEGDYLENFKFDTKLQQVGVERAMILDEVNLYANNDRNLVSKYATPELSKFYGSSPGMNTKLFGYTFGMNYTGRMSDIKEADVKFEDDYIKYALGDATENISSLLESEIAAPRKHIINTFINAGRMRRDGDVDYYFIDENRYAKYDKGTKESIRGTIENIDEFTDKNFKNHKATTNEYDNTSVSETQFSEGDIIREFPNNTQIDTSIPDTEVGDVYVTPAKKKKSLLSRTNDLFNTHKIESLAARFHTSNTLKGNGEIEETDTAKSRFGNSHGRNLLNKAESGMTNGYSNPYCRVWTYHHQYDRYTKAIRPFDDIEKVYAQDPYLAEYLGKTTNGRKYLMEHTVLDDNGMLKIAPKGSCGNLQTEIKDCMFSIENLAWQDVPRNQEYLSKEQQGPNGGRIMWFPPYDLDFNENVNVNWNQSNFIGRGEPVFTYSNTLRSGTLSFAILVDHPSIINNIPNKKIEGLQDSDLLRFFAGCDVPEMKGTQHCPENDVPPKKQSEEPVEDTAKKEKAIHIKFYVYFPNNYSGNSTKILENEWNTNGSSDGHDWFDYILFGEYTETTGKNGDRGYEMIYDSPSSVDGKGITLNPSGDVPAEIGYGTTYRSCKNWKETGVGKEVYQGRESDVKYLYRVDFDLHQYLHNKYSAGGAINERKMGPDSNYKDTRSFGLNGNFTNVPSDATHTFLDAIQAMVLTKRENFMGTKVYDKMQIDDSETVHTKINGAVMEDRVLKFRDLLLNGQPFDLKISAGATIQDSPNSELLARRRWRALHDLLVDYFDLDENLFKKYNKNKDLIYHENLRQIYDINTLDAKSQRFACVELWYDAPEVKSVSDSNTSNAAMGSGIVQESTSRAFISTAASLLGVENPLNETLEASVITDDKIERHEAQTAEVESGRYRYETEAEYFEKIEKDDPFIYKSIKNKFRYFNPAFHSISPEGINARLTFLQQCTRQGHTIAASDDGFAKTAGNLSFGRMPVCVLKIGDFINTRIVINSLSINYGASGNPQWDLNPEGIGVQPMYAKIQMGITILGGQSLDGPISRLQNAVSFNYYANTGVYDNRSDRIKRNAEAVQGDTVRQVKEKNGGEYTVNDRSEYSSVKTTYENIWAPYPNIIKK